MLDEKIKEKIQKLLNLSLSNNEHEAALAMSKAMELMNKYDVSIDEVKKQPLISSNLELMWIYPPQWAIDLLDGISKCSGCYAVWRDGYTIGSTKKYATLIVTGRTRDVENTVYLCSFLMRYITNKINQTRKEYTNNPNITSIMNGYRFGLVQGIINKIKEGQTTFFNNHNNENENALVPVDTKVQEAGDFYKSMHKVTVHSGVSQNINSAMLQRGLQEGASINIHQAVNNNDNTRLLGK